MPQYSPEFTRMLHFTTTQTLLHKEPTLLEIDPELAAEIEWQPTISREIWGEWGDNKNVRLISGVTDEGGDWFDMELVDGTIIDIHHIAHLNVNRRGQTYLQRHILDASGIVYQNSGEGFAPMTDTAIDELMTELEPITE